MASAETTKIPGVYVWEPPDKPISVRLSLDVVDRMLQDIMRGFGAVPKRGAEVGGILLGRAAAGDKTVVTIDDYVQVPIEYKRSPSYLLSEEDERAFEAEIKRARNASDPLLRPVGYFRSHTREGVGLGPEDVALLNLRFPEPETVALIIKPYATKVSQAGFYFRENGKFQSGPPLLGFPFRRRELDPDGAPSPARTGRSFDRPPPPPRSDFQERRRERTSSEPRVAASRPDPAPAFEHRPPATDSAPSVSQRAPVTSAAPTASRGAPDRAPEPRPDYAPVQLHGKRRSGWLWAPLSFIFLLLGVLLGFQTALFMRPQLPAGSNDPYNLSVTVTRNGNNLQVKWDRQSLAVRSAQRGTLTIEDGPLTKPVALNAADLQSGSVVYPPSTGHVTFRLEVMVTGRDMVTETIDWRQ